ncbi:MAG: class I SAM-dependent methyltransferase [Pseudomonadota bacterium]
MPLALAFSPARLTRRYDRAARWWPDTIARLGFPAAYRALVKDLHSGPRVLDAGAGSGAFAESHRDVHGPASELTLLEPSGPMLEKAAARFADPRTRLAAVQGYLGEVVIPPQDVVLCAHVIEHCPDPEAAVASLYAALRPGGTLALAVSRPHWCTAVLRLRWGHRAYRPAQVVSLLNAAGFARIRVCPFSSGVPGRTSCGYHAVRPVEDRTLSSSP